jgi:hypothetical protein
MDQQHETAREKMPKSDEGARAPEAVTENLVGKKQSRVPAIFRIFGCVDAGFKRVGGRVACGEEKQEKYGQIEEEIRQHTSGMRIAKLHR